MVEKEVTLQMKLQKVAFLDRDGVLCQYKDYLSKIEDFHIIPSSLLALKKLKEAGYLVFVMTNQPMVARGTLALSDLEKMHQLLDQSANAAGGRIEKIFFCPHDPGPPKPGYVLTYVHPCDCRKPGLGMFNQAKANLEFLGLKVDLAKSWMIGDSWRDLKLGDSAGLRIAGIRGTPSLKHDSLTREPEFTETSLLEVVDQILK